MHVIYFPCHLKLLALCNGDVKRFKWFVLRSNTDIDTISADCEPQNMQILYQQFNLHCDLYPTVISIQLQAKG